MKSLLIFVSGLVVGAGVTYIYQKNRYEEMIQEEVQSLREHAREKEEKTVVDNDELTFNHNNSDPVIAHGVHPDDKEELEEVESIIDNNNYASSDRESTPIDKYRVPHIITPEDFGSICGFDYGTYYYSNDGIISDDNREMIDEEDLVEILGMSTEEIASHFGEYEEDTVHVRNMRMKCDYEILRENEDYVKRNGD